MLGLMHWISPVTLLLASHALAAGDYQPAEWHSDDRVLSCAPKTVPADGTLVLTLGPGHGRELAVRRVSDGAWFFLVVGAPPYDVPQLMTTDEFAAAARVEIPASFQTRAWAVGAVMEPLLRHPGEYELYVSDILESEVGGYACGFSYQGMSPN